MIIPKKKNNAFLYEKYSEKHTIFCSKIGYIAVD